MNKGKAKHKPVFTDGDFKRILSCMGGHDYSIALAHEDELVFHAEKDLQTSGVRCFLKLATVFSNSGDYYDKAEHYLDRVMGINDKLGMISSEQFIHVFLAYLQIGKYQAGMVVYCNHLKGRLTIARVNEVLKGFMRAPEEGDCQAYGLQIMEDHLAVAEEFNGWNESHTFYNFLTSTYEDLNANIHQLREYIEMRLKITRDMGNEELECVIMIDTSTVYYKLVEYDKALNMLDESLELLKKMKEVIGITGNRTIMKMEISALYNRGLSIKQRSMAINGVLLPSDAEEALEMFNKAYKLATYESDIEMIGIFGLPMIFEEIARIHLEMREFDLALKHANRSIELYHQQINNMPGRAIVGVKISISHVHLLLGQLYLNKFHDLTLCDHICEPYDGRNARDLHSSMYHIEMGANTARKMITRAQVYYLQRETTKAYIYLATFLDTSIAEDPLMCGVCQQQNRSGSEMKQCSGCKIACYCSTRCQKIHWKTSIGVNSIPHKMLCPLLSYWRKKCKKEMKGKPKGENDEEEFDQWKMNDEQIDDNLHEEQIYERLTESCRSKFYLFFESLKQRGQEQARAKIQRQDEEFWKHSEPEVNSLETSYERLVGVD